MNAAWTVLEQWLRAVAAGAQQGLADLVTMPWYGWLGLVLGSLAGTVFALWYTKRPLRPALRRLLERIAG